MPKIAACVDIGSNVVRMHISQWDGKKIVTLDKLEKPTQLGKEVFSTGYISFATVNALSGVLSGFCEKAREYGISSVYAIASTALREASNQAYILDHLLTRNKLEVHVLEDTEVSSLMINAIKNSGYQPMENMLLVNGGTGTTDFVLLKNDKAILAHSIQTGLLKIAETLRETAGFSRHVEYMTEEYLDTFFMRENRIKDLWKADGIVFSAGDLQPLFNLFQSDGGAMEILRDSLTERYQAYRELSIDQICAEQELDNQRGGILYAMLTMLAALLRLTNAKKLFCVQTDIADAMQNLMLVPGARKKHNAGLRGGAVVSALDLAGRYRCDLNHAKFVAGTALAFFERLKWLIGLPAQKRHLLHIACILHEAGFYTNSADAQEASFDLIRDAHIYGLTSHDTLLTANIISPRNLLGIARGVWRGGALDGEDVLSAAKMHAILQLADALDYSRKQKAKLSGVELREGHLLISIKINEDFTLEQWRFKECASMVQEIFGITPVLTINNIYQTEGRSV